MMSRLVTMLAVVVVAIVGALAAPGKLATEKPSADKSIEAKVNALLSKMAV
jgi:hypothetical protein